MRKLMFALLALAISLFGTQCWATTQSCNGVETLSCTNTFSPGNTEGIYDFGNDGRLVVDFVTVLTPPPGFDLTVTVNHTIDPIDRHVFPRGTVCVKYEFNGSLCDEYDFTGSAGGPNGVPVQNTDYSGLITLTLTYDTVQAVHSPAFGHAPGDNARARYRENILTSYSSYPPCPDDVSCDNGGDPAMGGTLPGLSSVAAFDKPLEEDDCFVFVSPTEGQPFHVGDEIEVEFQLFDSTSCPVNPTGDKDALRDKDARLSLSRVDNGHLVFVAVGKDEGGNHFLFDDEEGVNEREVDTEGLKPGKYIITVFSDEFSPQSRTIVINP